jgi:tetratricopeptide (TPR) repeat protein
MKQWGFVLLFIFGSFSVFSQTETDIQLAQHYYATGEFDKAVTYYEKIFNTSPTKVYFNRYFECLVATKDYKTAEKVIKKQINQNKTEVDLKVMLGQFYEDIGQTEKAEKTYRELVDEIPDNPSQIISLYQALIAKQKLELAKAVLDKGKKVANYYPFNFQYADLYSLMGNKKEMIREYLDYVEIQPGMAESIEAALAMRLDLSNSENNDYSLLKEQLLTKSQKMNAPVVFSEMLIWMFTQNKNFEGAYTQVVALDKRFKGDGYRVFDLGNICVENKNYIVARKCFNYVISLGENKENFVPSYKALLNTRFLEITTNRNYSQREIDSTIFTYEQALNRLGRNRATLPMIIEQTMIEAFYADKAEKAKTELNEALQINGLTDIQKAQVKMQLADINVLSGDIWEASILYMQIDNDFKFEPIGQEAKFKNARVFYFDGEFDFAQSQLNVLKESTSKMIANDALQLSVMITDNYGLDSNFQAMSWFANAELLIEQHKYKEAFDLFDSIQTNYPYHALADEILFRKGKALEMQGQWQKAMDYYEDLVKFHGKDILADDALFRVADIYENNLNDKEKALEYYRRLAIDYKGSLFSAEARKRIRLLRGDKNISDDEL